MGFLEEMFLGQRRVTPDRNLEPRYTGKTLFTNREPVPLAHRVALVLFSLGFVVMLSIFLWVIRHDGGDSLAADVWFIVLTLVIAFWVVVGLLALLGIPPFQSKRR